MKTNPFFDTLQFLVQGGWPTYIFWLLLLGSTAVAAYNLFRAPRPHIVKDVWLCAARILLGSMWWQQSLWKLPPFYTDMPGVEDSGLRHWMGEMVRNASFSLQSKFVQDLVLPHFNFFAPLVYGTEVFIGVSLILGIFTRLGAALGALMALNLWLGLYRSPSEWPWTYFFLVLLQVTFAVLPVGRSLGVDEILARGPGGK
jgi:uncharacterized membrane protein YphA (DoxX/SURF4 family)